MPHPDVEQAVAFYMQGYTCTQSILASFGRRYNLEQILAEMLETTIPTNPKTL